MHMCNDVCKAGPIRQNVRAAVPAAVGRTATHAQPDQRRRAMLI